MCCGVKVQMRRPAQDCAGAARVSPHVCGDARYGLCTLLVVTHMPGRKSNHSHTQHELGCELLKLPPLLIASLLHPQLFSQSLQCQHSTTKVQRARAKVKVNLPHYCNQLARQTCWLYRTTTTVLTVLDSCQIKKAIVHNNMLGSRSVGVTVQGCSNKTHACRKSGRLHTGDTHRTKHTRLLVHIAQDTTTCAL